MRFRFPGWEELVALFFSDSSVTGALASLNRAKARLDRVTKAKRGEAHTLAKLEAEALREADRLSTETRAANDEADRAARVSSRLQELCA